MPADHPIRGASKVLPTGFPLVRVLTATANAHYRPTSLTTAAMEMRLRVSSCTIDRQLTPRTYLLAAFVPTGIGRTRVIGTGLRPLNNNTHTHTSNPTGEIVQSQFFLENG